MLKICELKSVPVFKSSIAIHVGRAREPKYRFECTSKRYLDAFTVANIQVHPSALSKCLRTVWSTSAMLMLGVAIQRGIEDARTVVPIHSCRYPSLIKTFYRGRTAAYPRRWRTVRTDQGLRKPQRYNQSTIFAMGRASISVPCVHLEST